MSKCLAMFLLPRMGWDGMGWNGNEMEWIGGWDGMGWNGWDGMASRSHPMKVPCWAFGQEWPSWALDQPLAMITTMPFEAN